jgi:putative SOS response-associated peptidase YedK
VRSRALWQPLGAQSCDEDWAQWLGEEPATNDELKALLVPFKDDALTMWPVNRQKIGNARNKDREVVLPELVS